MRASNMLGKEKGIWKPWAKYLPSPNINFLICKVGIIFTIEC